MLPNQSFFDELFRERVRQARSMSPEERVRRGLERSDLAFRIMADSVRHQFPTATEAEVQQRVGARVTRVRQLKNLR